MSGPRVVCVACGVPINSLLSPLCGACATGMPEKGTDQHVGQMIAARAAISNVVVPKAPFDHDKVAALIASELAALDGYDPNDPNSGLYDLRWSGGPTPEPEGDAWNMDYMPKGEHIAAAVAAFMQGESP